ncbi:MAG: ABC transporter permease [Candidatus Izimaplasma sp.]|nr:ABC transporter permease [Candidatus Izimaplasma bacterium]
MTKKDFEFITREEKLDNEQTRKSLTYWQDVWRRLKKNRLSMFGLIGVIIVILFGVFGPWLTPYDYSDQLLDYSNLPPSFEIYKLDDDFYVYVTKEYRVLETTEKGKLLGRIDYIHKDIINKIYYYAKEYELVIPDNETGNYPLGVTLDAGSVYSEKWGVAFKDSVNVAGKDQIELTYIHPDSPFYAALKDGEAFDFTSDDFTLTSIDLIDDINAASPVETSLEINAGAQAIVDQLELSNHISDVVFGGKIIEVNFSYKLMDEGEHPAGYEDVKVAVTYNDVENKYVYDKVSNSTYLWGSDMLGRDMLTRVMFGARISLTIAFVATLVNFFIGIFYGSIAGYSGGNTDNYMMRIVDIINSIPLVLYVILLMVLLKEVVIDVTIFGHYYVIFKGGAGLGTIIIALGSIYWVGMARLVRGQILGLKEQEFVLAAKTIGVSRFKIITRHLVPNSMGPIIVSMTMMIPSAVFTEAFLSFIGLGISAPKASWGTLANEALSGLTTYPYQLFFPSAAIAFTMLAFNFLGDGLRDALDPRLRKG